MTIIPQQSDIQSITTVESINHRKEKSQYGKNVANLSITGSKIIARNCYICNKMGRLCYISRCYRDYRSAGNKAKIDNEQSLKEMGAINLGLSQRIGGGKIATFIAGVCGVARYALKVRKGDVVVLQYPIKKYFSLICRISRLRGATTIAFIHDLGSFRRKKLTPRQEIRRLNHADNVIAANASMERWLSEQGCRCRLSWLGLHDYRSPAQAPQRPYSRRKVVVYAGSLNNRKNSFLLQLPAIAHNVDIHLYGDKENLHGMEASDSLKINGFMDADEFISSVKGDFGLVWDGNSSDECSGNWGEYLKINTPHKVSFYIRSHLPVVVWRQSAVASIVEKEGIGVCINSLAELNRLNDITEEKMTEMLANVSRVAERLSKGDNFKHAIREAMKQSLLSS